ncbi:MAG: IPExxxVDY family protein [Flavobacteriales bacterium]|nr:IPExxxVDY family protein [Flavobacteriales bacterium]
MAKYRLEEKPLRPHVVVGISCHVPDYRLCWSVNKGLGLELTRRREAITELVRGKELHYTVFEVKGRDGEARFALICNTCGNRRLLPGQKEADYFLVVDPETAELRPDLLDQLRRCDFVLTAFPVDISRSKSGHKLLLCDPDERTEDQDRRHPRPGKQLA